MRPLLFTDVATGGDLADAHTKIQGFLSFLFN